MKKSIKQTLIIITLAILTITAITVVAYAANINAVFSLSSNKDTYKKGEVVTLIASITSIESPNGVDTLGGTIDFDRNYFENLQIKGLDGWSSSVNPNPNNGKFIIDYAGEINHVGQMLEIKLTVKNNITEGKDVTISLRDLTYARGNDKGSYESVSKTVKIVLDEEGGNTVTPPPAEQNEVTPPPAEQNEVTPPPAEVNEVTPPPAGGNEVTPPPAGGNEETPPAGGNEVTPPAGGNEETPPAGENTATPPSANDTNPGTTGQNNEAGQVENIPKDKELPKTGANKIVLNIAIVTIAILIVVFYFKMRNSNYNIKSKNKHKK